MYGFETSASTTQNMSTGTLVAYIVFCIIMCVVMFVALWKIFTKAGKPGWGAIVPIYDLYLEFEIAFGNGWLFLLMLVPIVNFVVAIILPFKLAKAFGKGAGFGLGLLFLPIIFHLILAFGSAEYQN